MTTTDESLDIDGHDAAVKLHALLIILSSHSPYLEVVDMMMDERGTMSVMIPTMDKIHRVNGGMKYRLVASAMREKIPMSGNTNGDHVR
ncbi:LOW QUALITY PROTEIN: hypothetical protein ACHAXA_006969 [Cyclostephanos tholiformis]|uniref:Uncharacterized protein n=1 Tax=Cyclostephanos tholiformis TaxID=382380 RepID=A0ABD3RXD3_9STRA